MSKDALLIRRLGMRRCLRLCYTFLRALEFLTLLLPSTVAMLLLLLLTVLVVLILILVFFLFMLMQPPISLHLPQTARRSRRMLQNHNPSDMLAVLLPELNNTSIIELCAGLNCSSSYDSSP